MFPNLHQLRSLKTRQRLLEAALELLAQRGDLGVSLQEVARQAGMTTGAVQHHFESIAGLRSEVLSRLVESLGEADGFWPDATWPLEQRAAHFVSAAWRQVFGAPRFGTAWAAFLGARAHKPTRAHVVQRLAPIMVGMAEQLLRSFPELAARPDGRARAEFVLAALRGMGLAAPFCPPGFFDHHLALLGEYLVTACRPPTPAPRAPARGGAARSHARPTTRKRRSARASAARSRGERAWRRCAASRGA
jgi:AcrR family transcriptional regulator